MKPTKKNTVGTFKNCNFKIQTALFSVYKINYIFLSIIIISLNTKDVSEHNILSQLVPF